ncbi:MAG: ADP-glyceromanno-heptose 6-epimerase [Candidatus Omnitrophota bacterium]|nr:ADP-glyceromanno-heptose 6-epimerase [Candidatus Omnitrophota bacterium]
MKALVTGAAGFIGSNVVKILEDRGAETFILDDFSYANFRNLEGTKGEVICADIVDGNIFNKLPKVDAIIHEAAITDTTLRDDKKMITVNYNGFRNVFNFCAGKKIKLVYISSAGVYGDGPSPMKETQKLRPLNAYAYSKYLCDCYASRYMAKKNLPLIVGIRYFNIYGPGEYHKGSAASMIYQLYLQMKEGKRPRVFKHGQQKRDFIYVKDVARLTVEALDLKKNLIVNVGTGKARSFNDIIAALNNAMGKNLKPDYFDNPFTGVYQDFTEADSSLLKKNFKTPPQFSLEEGILDYVENYLSLVV